MYTQLFITLARYNRWMNQHLYQACAKLPDAERKQDRGAFFKSIHGTLNHILLGDKIWMSRFTNQPFTVFGLDVELYADFTELERERGYTDEEIITWVDTLTESCLAETLEYTSITNPEPRRIMMWLAVTHFFNHQTHHRGQVTVLLSQASIDYGVTDLISLPGA